jgi:hypothetical protein
VAEYNAPSMFGFDLLKKRKGMYNDAAAERLQPGQSTVSGLGGGGYGQYGQGNLFGAGGPINRDQADALQNNPLWNVEARTHQSAPYPDAILREQAAINAGYDPNFQPNVSNVPPSQRDAEAAAQRAANQDISPIGGSSYAAATEMAGESQTITNFSKSLDRDFLAAAFGSLMQPPEQGSAAGGGMGDVRINQPQPGDFGMQFSMYGDKKKKRGLFG